MSKIYTSADQLIGKTPLLELTHIEKALGLKARVLAKLEYFNPAGSVKDRVAKAMIDAAEAAGKLVPGAVIIEPTSGNTGLGLASVAAARGYRMILVMPDTMSVERRQLARAFGAELVLTPGAQGMKGAIAKAEELTREIPHSFIPGQFDNPANPQAHRETTGPEIYADTDGEVDIFVAGVGTGGTVTGVGEYLKAQNPGVKATQISPCFFSGWARTYSHSVIISATPALSSPPSRVSPSVTSSSWPRCAGSGVRRIFFSAFSRISPPSQRTARACTGPPGTASEVSIWAMRPMAGAAGSLPGMRPYT